MNAKEKLQQMHAAIKMLEELQLPISKDQRQALRNAENDYIDNDLIPSLRQDILPLFDIVENPVKIELSYTRDRRIILNRIDDSQATDQQLKFIPEQGNSGKKTFIIKVTFPDSTVFCNKFVKDTVAETIKHIGCKKVYDLKIPMLGSYLVDTKKHENIRYSSTQIELEPGYFLLTTGDSDRKIEQLKTISKRLNLGLVIDKVSYETDTSKSRSTNSQNSVKRRETYSLENGNYTNKGLFVVEIVARLLKDNPTWSYNQILHILPINTPKNRTIIKLTEWETKPEKAKARYITNKVFRSADGIDFYVSNQWTKDAFEDRIFPLLRRFGYSWKEK